MKTEPNSRKRTRHTELTSWVDIQSLSTRPLLTMSQGRNQVCLQIQCGTDREPRESTSRRDHTPASGRAHSEQSTRRKPLQVQPTNLELVHRSCRWLRPKPIRLRAPEYSGWILWRHDSPVSGHQTVRLQQISFPSFFPGFDSLPYFTDRWTAICRGAVIQGLTSRQLSPNLNVEVKSRIARHNYGIKLRQAFDPKKHDVRDKAWDERERCWEAKNQMEWLLKQVCQILFNRATQVRQLMPQSGRGHDGSQTR